MTYKHFEIVSGDLDPKAGALIDRLLGLWPRSKRKTYKTEASVRKNTDKDLGTLQEYLLQRGDPEVDTGLVVLRALGGKYADRFIPVFIEPTSGKRLLEKWGFITVGRVLYTGHPEPPFIVCEGKTRSVWDE